ncbi:MAG: VOC family protein [Rhodospirillaceae bacterium]
MPSADRLDHAVIFVKYGMDAAEALFAGLGFTLTPRGYHSHGSHNHLMMFGTDYLELLGIPEGEEIERKDLMAAQVGINGLVFKTGDIDAIYARFQAAGFAGDPPRAFHRPLEVDGETKEARFKTVTARADAFPGGRVYFCEHGTPELVWRPEWQSHANGVVAIPKFVTVAEDAEGEAARFATLLATNVQTDKAGARLAALDGCRITCLTPDRYAARYGALASPMNGRPAIFGALVFATENLKALDAHLNVDGITVERGDGRTVVRLDAFDAVLEFVAV